MKSDLSNFLLKHFGHLEGVKSSSSTLNVVALAGHLNVHPYTIWRWLNKGVPWKGAQTLMRASDGKIDRSAILPFLAG